MCCVQPASPNEQLQVVQSCLPASQGARMDRHGPALTWEGCAAARVAETSDGPAEAPSGSLAATAAASLRSASVACDNLGI